MKHDFFGILILIYIGAVRFQKDHLGRRVKSELGQFKVSEKCKILQKISSPSLYKTLRFSKFHFRKSMLLSATKITSST